LHAGQILRESAANLFDGNAEPRCRVPDRLALLAEALLKLVPGRAMLLLGDGEGRRLVGRRLDEEAVTAVRRLDRLIVLQKPHPVTDRVVEEETAIFLQPIADQVFPNVLLVELDVEPVVPGVETDLGADRPVINDLDLAAE